MSRLDLNSAIHQPAGPVVSGSDVSSTTSTGSAKSTATGARIADQASVSDAAGIVAKSLSGSDVRTARVAALQKAIAAGTYNVPAGALADKLISSLLGES